MKNIYLIIAHRNFFQLQFLVRILEQESSYFMIHIDSKCDRNNKSLRYLLKRKNVFFIDQGESLPVNWGGFSQVDATLKLMKMTESLFSSDQLYYLHLLSGMDFPIKPIAAINKFFFDNYGKIFIHNNALPYKEWQDNGGLDRVQYKWNIDKFGFQRIQNSSQDRKTFESTYIRRKKLKFYGGSQWWSMPSGCMSYILREINGNDDILETFRYVCIPDEIFFQTIISNSRFYADVINNNYRYIDWETGPEFPKVLRNDDFDKLIVSADFFARKIDITVESSLNLLTKISEHIAIK